MVLLLKDCLSYTSTTSFYRAPLHLDHPVHRPTMVLSYSAIAQPSADTPKTISIVTPSRPDEVPSKSDGPAGPSSPAPSQASPPSTTNEQSVSATGYETGPSGISGPSAPVSTAGPSTPGITHLILDAGPLLSLTPLRHLASSFHTTPLVLAELRDPKAREHWERLGLSGVDVRVEPPKPEAMAKGKCGTGLALSGVCIREELPSRRVVLMTHSRGIC
jgi:RNA-binding protein NOB1